jgi:DNA polymerase-1
LYTSVVAPGFEADDAMASMVDRYKDKEKIIIWSNDKDLLQLIQKNVIVIKNYAELNKLYKWSTKTVQQRFNGLLPCELPIYYALQGDKSDNIPGAPRLRKTTLQRAIVNARYAENLIAAIIDFELWSAGELRNLEQFVASGHFQRNIELIVLRRPDVIIRESVYNEEKIREWLTMMEFHTFRLNEKVGMINTEAEF